jgi:hypothetical protein
MDSNGSNTIAAAGNFNVSGSSTIAGTVSLASSLTVSAVSGDTTALGRLVANGDTTTPARSNFRMVPQDAQPTGPNEVGDLYVTTAGVLMICTAAGSPGTWTVVGTQT